MISELISLVLREFGLNQAQLAEVMGVNVQRVRNLSAGLVKKLTREESEALVKKLHIRAEWLVTGEGPMLQTPDEQEFQRRLDALALASQQAGASGMTREQADLLQQCAVNQQVQPYGLSPDEADLLGYYRRMPEEARAPFLATGAALAKTRRDD